MLPFQIVLQTTSNNTGCSWIPLEMRHRIKIFQRSLAFSSEKHTQSHRRHKKGIAQDTYMVTNVRKECPVISLCMKDCFCVHPHYNTPPVPFTFWLVQSWWSISPWEGVSCFIFYRNIIWTKEFWTSNFNLERMYNNSRYGHLPLAIKILLRLLRNISA